MSRLTATATDVIRALNRLGWREHHSTGSHRSLHHPARPGAVTIPYHSGNLKPKTFRSILKQTGISREELLKLR